MLAADDTENKKKEIDGPVISFDLGTTYSCEDFFKNGRVEIIPNELRNKKTTSQVSFKFEEKFVEKAAKNQGALNPLKKIYVLQTLIGRKFEDGKV